MVERAGLLRCQPDDSQLSLRCFIDLTAMMGPAAGDGVSECVASATPTYTRFLPDCFSVVCVAPFASRVFSVPMTSTA